ANAATPLPDAVAMLVYDTLLGRDGAMKQFDEDVQKIRKGVASLPQQLAAYGKKIAAEAPDSDRALASYAGTYTDEALGTFVVREEGDALKATSGDRTAPLVRARGDAFYV